MISDANANIGSIGVQILPRTKLIEVEEQVIRMTLMFTRGHRGRATVYLGIARSALKRKEGAFGIPKHFGKR